MPSLLFINKSFHSTTLTHSTGKERFLIGSHISRQHKRKSKTAARLSSADPSSEVGCQPPAKQDNVVFPSRQRLEYEKKHALLLPMCGPGQCVDPFNSTALAINRDACKMIAFFMAWTTPQENILTIEPVDTSLSYRVATVRPNEVVERAIANDVHMASLLSFVACLMDAERPGQQGLTRIWEITYHALGLLRKQLEAEAHSDLVFDILNLAYAALYLGETDAARRHIKALGDLVSLAGGYRVLAPHTLPSIMYADVCSSLPGLRATVFDMSGHQLPSHPPMPWSPIPALYAEAQLARMQLVHFSLNEQCKEYSMHIIEMAQVLYHTHAASQQSLNTYWVMLKCLTLLSNLLTAFQKDIESNQGWNAVAFPSTNTVDLLRLETTKICLLLWLLLLRMAVWGRTESSEFMPSFETSLLNRYKSGGLGQDIYTALSTWNIVLRPYRTLFEKQKSVATPSSAQKLAFDMAAVITKLERGAGIQLGKFMNHFLCLEGRLRGTRPAVNSLALITSTQISQAVRE